MRLQGAIFDFDETLFDAAGALLPGLERFLSLMQVESVWMYAVTARPAAEVQQALKTKRLASYFRGVLSAPEHGTTIEDAALYQSAVRRLRTAPPATAVFTRREALIAPLHAVGLPVILVGAGHTAQAQAEAEQVIETYEEMVQQTAL